jgi:hypothetical protein
MLIQEFNLREIKKTLNSNCSEVAKIGVFRSGYFGGYLEDVRMEIFNPSTKNILFFIIFHTIIHFTPQLKTTIFW